MSELEINPENYYLDVLQNPDYYLTGEKPTFKKVIKEAYSREQVLKLLEPHLTIPKSIADELDRVEMNWNTLKDEAQGWPSDDLIMWLDAGNNPLMFAYLAGKALGVDLVKVVADEN